MFNINGLNDDEVIKSRKKYGNNSISGSNKNSFFRLFIETLGDPIIKILLIALAVKILFLFRDFDYFETIGIVMAIIVASLISALSEYGSNKAFQRMQEESSKIRVRVRRNKFITEIPIDDVVTDDIIILSSGDKVPADGILVRGRLSVDESSLNGEAKEVYKECSSDINIVSDKNKVFRGSVIYDGEAEVLATKVGMDTMYGKMAKVLTEEDEMSPLKMRLTNLAKVISRIGYISAILIGVSYMFSQIFIKYNFDINLIKDNVTLHVFLSYLLEAMTISVSILVMSVPEGLPMMITLVLSVNAKKMFKDNVLVRKMVGIETAGSLNILFTDKTGTITKGVMEVVSVSDGDLNEYYFKNELKGNYKTILEDALIYNNEAVYDNTINKIIGGNITDKALLSYAGKKIDNDVKILDKVLFNSKNKYSISVIEKEGRKIKLIKGAYDVVLKHCNYYIDCNGKKKLLDKDRLLDYIDKKTGRGLRTIVVCISESIYPTDNIRRNILISVIFIKDDIRDEAKEGINLIKNAMINIVMVTGDAKNTAYNIAKEVGIIDSDKDIVLSSSELAMMNDDEVKRILPNLKVVARALPLDKKRLVTLAKEMGLVTGMTGDGVNDSIALKKADVSFAMGSGTEVSKEASDIVILDDNIMSISKAILYGRTIFKNIRKFIIFQLTVNVSAVLLSLICPFIGIATPITVIQMLWINMVMDTLAGLAFSYESYRAEYMMEKPKKKNENIINKYMIWEILIIGLYFLILCIVYLKLPIIKTFFVDDNHFMTGFFTLFILLAVFNAFNARTHRLNIFSNLSKNKMFVFIILFVIIIQLVIIYSGMSIFNTTPLLFNEFMLVLIFSVTIIPVDFVRKCILKRFNVELGV